MGIANFDLYVSRREILSVALAVIVSIGLTIFIFYSFLIPAPENLESFSFAKERAVIGSSLSFTESYCDVYISPPDRQIKYFDTLVCSDLDKTTISRNDLLNFGNGQKGTYSVIVFAEDTNEGTTSSFTIS